MGSSWLESLYRNRALQCRNEPIGTQRARVVAIQNCWVKTLYQELPTGIVAGCENDIHTPHNTVFLIRTNYLEGVSSLAVELALLLGEVLDVTLVLGRLVEFRDSLGESGLVFED